MFWKLEWVYFSIRALLGKNILKNAVHAPTDETKARAEIRLAFGDELEFDEDGNVKEAAESGTTLFENVKYLVNVTIYTEN